VANNFPAAIAVAPGKRFSRPPLAAAEIQLPFVGAKICAPAQHATPKAKRGYGSPREKRLVIERESATAAPVALAEDDHQGQFFFAGGNAAMRAHVS
jgi:hypothetical protein